MLNVNYSELLIYLQAAHYMAHLIEYFILDCIAAHTVVNHFSAVTQAFFWVEFESSL